VAVGNLAACAWMSDGSAKCWGLNIGGDLGNGGGALADTWGPDPPGIVTGLSGAMSVTMGSHHACAQTEAGRDVLGSEPRRADRQRLRGRRVRARRGARFSGQVRCVTTPIVVPWTP
jgi:hypothetical protein